MVLTAASGKDESADRAMRELCEVYVEPIRQWLKGAYRRPEKADDLAHAFIEHLLTKNRLRDFERTESKFRSFLIQCLKRFVRGEWRKDQAEKRGGGQELVDADEAAISFEPDYVRQLDLKLAVEAHRRALRSLEHNEYAKKEAVFRALKPFIFRETDSSYEEVARSLGIKANYVKKLVYDLRHCYMGAFRREVGETVDPTEHDDETRYLLGLVISNPDAEDSEDRTPTPS